MPGNNSTYRLFIIATAFLLFSNSHAQAEPRAFSGVITSIIADKSCPEKTDNHEITLVFDGESASAGWFYGKGLNAAELKRISPTRFDVTYAVTRLSNLPPSSMELLPTKDGMHVIVRDHVPEDKEIRESACFFEKMEADLKPLSEPTDELIKHGKEIFSADLLMDEGNNLLWSKKDYKAAIERGRKYITRFIRVTGDIESVMPLYIEGKLPSGLRSSIC